MPDPIRVGETHILWTYTWTRKGNTIIDLSGATITGRKSPHGNDMGAAAITGTIVVTNGPAGQFTLAPSPGDVSASGFFDFQFKAVFGDGTVLLSNRYVQEIEKAL